MAERRVVNRLAEHIRERLNTNPDALARRRDRAVRSKAMSESTAPIVEPEGALYPLPTPEFGIIQAQGCLCCGVCEINLIHAIGSVLGASSTAAEVWLGQSKLRRFDCEIVFEQALRALARHNKFNTTTGLLAAKFIIFTGRAAGTNIGPGRVAPYGEEFRSWLEGKGFGLTSRTGPAQNPNTTNWITVYVFEADRDAIAKWYLSRNAVANKNTFVAPTSTPPATPR